MRMNKRQMCSSKASRTMRAQLTLLGTKSLPMCRYRFCNSVQRRSRSRASRSKDKGIRRNPRRTMVRKRTRPVASSRASTVRNRKHRWLWPTATCLRETRTIVVHVGAGVRSRTCRGSGAVWTADGGVGRGGDVHYQRFVDKTPRESP